MKKSICLVALILSVVAFDVLVATKYIAASRESADDAIPSAPMAEDPYAYYVELDEGSLGYDPVIAQANANHKQLRALYDVPGIDEPRLLSVEESQLKDSEQVVGIDVGGATFAFSLRAMEFEDAHIVNLVLGKTPLSVSYCPMADCVRVLASTGESAIPLRLGGLNDEDEMVFLLNGERYDQSSLKIPLADHEFSKSTFGDWRRRHPTTKVFTQKSRQRS